MFSLPEDLPKEGNTFPTGVSLWQIEVREEKPTCLRGLELLARKAVTETLPSYGAGDFFFRRIPIW